MALLESYKNEIENVGLQIVTIGHGKTAHAIRYGGKLAPSLKCYVDNQPNEILYRSYGLTEPASLKESLSMDLMKSALETTLRGHFQGKVLGNAAMIPGSFIVDASGSIQWIHYNKHAGDHPKLKDILIGV